MTDEDYAVPYGKCCVCLKENQPLPGVVSMPALAPIPKPVTGWMCMQCGAGEDHMFAVAAMCTPCCDMFEEVHANGGNVNITWVVTDNIASNERTRLEDCPEGYPGHDISKHPEMAEYN